MKRSVLWDNVKRVDEKEEKPRAIPWGRGKSGIDMWKYAASPQHCFRLHTYTLLCWVGTHTEIKKRSAAGTRSRWGGGGRSKIPAKRIYSKGYIFAPPTSWISNILQCRRSNYNVFDGSTNTHTRQCGHWPLAKKKSRSVRKFSQNHCCWGLWWSLMKEMPSLLVGTFGWEDISHILLAPTKTYSSPHLCHGMSWIAIIMPRWPLIFSINKSKLL